MKKSQLYIAELIFKHLKQTLTKNEREELDEWLNTSIEHQKLFTSLCRKESYTAKTELYKRFKKQENYKKLQSRIFKQKRRGFLRYASAAAVLLLFVGIAGYYYRSIQQSYRQTIVCEQEIKPGKSKAILQTSTGKKIELGKQDFAFSSQGYTEVFCKNNTIAYKKISKTPKASAPEEVYNTLSVPRGGEYKLVLADGTKVWLNSESSISYPVEFLKPHREVFVSGEVYFEVVHNVQKPFWVRLQDGAKIAVTGTAFNVRNYNDESKLEVVLERGSVNFHYTESESVSLTPGMLASYNPQNTTVKRTQVNTSLYTAWRKGEFIFESAPLDEIMNTLARWYDVRIHFEEESIKKIRFSGSIKRYDTINTFLQAMESAKGIEFSIDNNTIYLRRQNKTL